MPQRLKRQFCRPHRLLAESEGRCLARHTFIGDGNAAWRGWHGVALTAQGSQPCVSVAFATCRDVLPVGAVFQCLPAAFCVRASASAPDHSWIIASLSRCSCHKTIALVLPHSCVLILIPTHHAYHCALHAVLSLVIPVSLTLYWSHRHPFVSCR